MNAQNEPRPVLWDEIKQWTTDDDAVAVVFEESLASTGGPDWPVKPPTFAKEKDENGGDKVGRYQIDTLPNGSSVCLMDSVQSQNNRREPIFLQPPYRELVSDVRMIYPDGSEKNLLELPHRAADVSIRFSEGREQITKAFRAYESGDAWPMATLAPTSLVFGAWDSRETSVKIPRIVGGQVLAFDAHPIGAPFQYFPARQFSKLLYGEDASAPKKLSGEGLAEALGQGLGGVIVHGGIKLKLEVNLRALRAIGARSNHLPDEERTVRLRTYILLLSLIAATAPASYWLRQGCNLKKTAASAKLVRTNRDDEAIRLPSAEEIAKFARDHLAELIDLEQPQQWRFDSDKARAAVAIVKARRGRPSKAAGTTAQAADADDDAEPDLGIGES